MFVMLPHLGIPKLTLQVYKSQYWQVKTQCVGKFKNNYGKRGQLYAQSMSINTLPPIITQWLQWLCSHSNRIWLWVLYLTPLYGCILTVYGSDNCILSPNSHLYIFATLQTPAVCELNWPTSGLSRNSVRKKHSALHSSMSRVAFSCVVSYKDGDMSRVSCQGFRFSLFLPLELHTCVVCVWLKCSFSTQG